MPRKLVLADSNAGGAHGLPAAFDCSWANDGPGAAWVHLAGELDVATTPQLEAALRALRARLVVLDLRELAFMDSSGVHAIVDASIRARDVGRRILLLAGPPPWTACSRSPRARTMSSTATSTRSSRPPRRS